LTRLLLTRRTTSEFYSSWAKIRAIYCFYFSLPTAKISNPDVTRIINSDEVQSIVRPSQGKKQRRPWTQHKNPLVNKGVLFKLNPYAKKLRSQELGKSLTTLSVVQNLTRDFSQTKQEEGRFRQGQEGHQGCRRDLPHHSPCSLNDEFDLICCVPLDFSEVWSMYALWGCLSTAMPCPFDLMSLWDCRDKHSSEKVIKKRQ
jgi:hypothetical protein